MVLAIVKSVGAVRLSFVQFNFTAFNFTSALMLSKLTRQFGREAYDFLVD